MEKYLIHSNELHLIDAGKIHQAVEKMVESLDLAAGSTSNFDLYQVVESYFKDLEKEGKSTMYWGSKKTDMNLLRISASNKKKFSNHTRQFVHNRVGGKRSRSFPPTFVFRPLTPPYVPFGIRRFS